MTDENLRLIGPNRDLPITMSARTAGFASPAERIHAAAECGYTGVGLSIDQLFPDLSTQALEFVAKTAKNAGIAIAEVEFLSAWATSDTKLAQKELTDALNLVRTFSPQRVHVGSIQRPLASGSQYRLREICEAMAPTTVALEFMPFGGIPDISGAADVIDQLQCSNLGVLIDLWHWIKSKPRSWTIPTVLADRVVAVQLADVSDTSDQGRRTESLTARAIPGEGVGPVVRILKSLKAQGVQPSLDVEVMSTELEQLPAQSVACQSYAGAVMTLECARWLQR